MKNSISGLLNPAIQFGLEEKTKHVTLLVYTVLSSWKQIQQQSQQTDDKTWYDTRDTYSCIVNIAEVTLAAVDFAIGDRSSGAIWKFALCKENVIVIHRMQIWRTTRSLPGTSHESEAIEASVFCFDNASPEKSCCVDGLG